MRQIIEEIRNGGSVPEVLNAHRSEVIRYAALLLVLLTAMLLFSYRGGGEVDIADLAEPADAAAEEQPDDELNGSAGNEGTRNEGTGSEGVQNDGAQENESGEQAAAQGKVFVDIGGAVKEPMLAELPAGSRVEDAIRAAGGLKEDADLSSVNRAAVLSDGEKIYIPKEGEDPAVSVSGQSSGYGAEPGTATADLSAARININTADKETLQQITGVGPATAQKILDYRTQNGTFRAPEDLKNVSGIGEKTYEKMKDQITV